MFDDARTADWYAAPGFDPFTVWKVGLPGRRAFGTDRGDKQRVAELVLVWEVPDSRVVRMVEEKSAQERLPHCKRVPTLGGEVRDQSLAQPHELTEETNQIGVAGLLGDVPWCAVARRHAVVVELRVVLHDRRKACGSGAAEIELRRRQLT